MGSIRKTVNAVRMPWHLSSNALELRMSSVERSTSCSALIESCMERLDIAYVFPLKKKLGRSKGGRRPLMRPLPTLPIN